MLNFIISWLFIRGTRNRATVVTAFAADPIRLTADGPAWLLPATDRAAHRREPQNRPTMETSWPCTRDRRETNGTDSSRRPRLA